MRKLSYGLGATALLSFGACADQGNTVDPLDFGANGTGIEFTIAPLDLPGVTDACYSFQVVNGLGETVVARGSAQDAAGTGVAGQNGDGGPYVYSAADPTTSPLCGSQFGFGGEISYVAPCDASPGATFPSTGQPCDPANGDPGCIPTAQHDITLWVNAVCQDGTGFGAGCTPFNGFVNPCGSAGCTVTATCVENADVPVTFNFTVMASAQQGFFDIAVNFDNVFCSAKLDTCYEDGSKIELLFPAGGTSRAHTAVAAVSCTTGPTPGGEPDAVNTYLHFTDFEVRCDETYTLSLGGVAQEGNISIPGGGGGNLDGAVYFGTEGLEDMNKVYTTVAFVLPAGEQCKVAWSVVPSTSDTGPVPTDGFTGSGVYTQVAGVDFQDVDVEAGVCHRNQLNGTPTLQEPPSQVVTEYFTDELTYTGTLTQNATAFESP